MKKIFALSACLCIFILQPAIACSTFFINSNGELVFGRNYDWVSGAGMVCSNLRGLDKTSIKMEDGNTINWISRYGSMTFNQYGKEFPTGGMNEKGLVVELMWAEGTVYPKTDNRPALGVLQWIQYQLDNNATIEEVIASDEKIRISVHNPPLHYLIADANGNAATIEFFNGKLVAHKGKDLPFPVLTNNSYTESAKAAMDAKILTGNKNFSFENNSLQRFTKACSMVQEFQLTTKDKPAVDYAFNILHDVAQGSFTKWSIVYDLKNKTIYFKTADYPNIKSIILEAHNFTCSAGAKMLDMNQELKGQVDQNFIPFNNELNRTVLEKAIRESIERVHVTEKQKMVLIDYAGKVKCK